MAGMADAKPGVDTGVVSGRETVPYLRFKNYTIADLKDCIGYLGNSAWIRARAIEELEYRGRTGVLNGE